MRKAIGFVSALLILGGLVACQGPAVQRGTHPQPDVEVSRGGVPGYSVVQKFGHNLDVGTSYENVAADGVMGFLTVADEVRVKAGGNAADHVDAGAGAREITIVGLDATFANATETVEPMGASASAVTTTKFIRVFRAYVSGSGAYGANNTGAVTIQTEGSTDLTVIPATLGQTQTSHYTVPTGYTAYIKRAWAYVATGTGKTASIRIRVRPDADDIVAPFSPARVILSADEIAGSIYTEFHALEGIPAKSDIYAEAIGAASTQVTLNYDIILVQD